ncbi:MAG: enoyl-CoA hydratase/isomerase family protein [Terriglobia bacterium]
MTQFFSSVDSVAVLAFPEAETYPRLTSAVLAEIGEHLAAIEDSDCFTGVVIAANSRSFATGAELEEITHLEGFAAREFARAGQALLRRIVTFPLPVAAAIRGYCLGGALDLALACHSRVATYDSSFGHPGPTLGLMTGWGGTQTLPRLLGRTAALQILLTGERLPATQALTLGLVDELVLAADLVAAAAQRTRKIEIRSQKSES